MNKEETLKKLNSCNRSTLMETLAIEYIDIGEDMLKAKMPVTSRVYQPYGILHGGAVAALAETVGSLASVLSLNSEEKIVKGIDLIINHLRSKKEGVVYAVAYPIHKGKTTHLWEIKITDEKDTLISICKLTSIILNKK